MIARAFLRAAQPRPALLALSALLLSLATACAGVQQSGEEQGNDDTAVTAETFERLRDHPEQLRMFLQAMPKGGDLHNHLSGAAYPESYIDWALQDGLCLEVDSYTLVTPPCEDTPTLASPLETNEIDRNELIDAWSLRNFVASEEFPSKHDLFFATFLRFDPVVQRHYGDILAEVVRRNAAQQISHLELIRAFAIGDAMQLAQNLGLEEAGPEAEARLRTGGLEEVIAQAQADLDRMETGAENKLDCDFGVEGDCPLSVRYIAEVLRTVPLPQQLAQLMVAFELAERDPRVVAVNLVGPEDNNHVLESYREQMELVGRLSEQYPDVGITLHAGELTLGLVPPEDLSDHVRQAIEIAGATRIGHGVDIAYEERPESLLRQMANKGIAVETNLTSNAELLGVKGAEHPFPTYLKYGVPTVLSTDDEGLLRNDLTHEYHRAVESYDLDYAQVKELSRRNLEIAFLPGESLWADFETARPVDVCRGDTPECRAFLEDNKRARLQWELEESFQEFEAERAALLREGVMPPLSTYDED